MSEYQFLQAGQGFPVAPGMDGSKVEVSVYGKNVAPGDTAALLTAAGRTQIASATGPAAADALSYALALCNDDLPRLLGTAPHLFNGSTWDRQRANSSNSALPLASRTVTTDSAQIVNHNARGVLAALQVTVNPGGAQTLALGILGVYPGIAAPQFLASATAVAFGGATGVQQFLLYPGAGVAPSGGTASGFANSALPRDFLFRVTPSGAGAWTYSVSYQLIL